MGVVLVNVAVFPEGRSSTLAHVLRKGTGVSGWYTLTSVQVSPIFTATPLGYLIVPMPMVAMPTLSLYALRKHPSKSLMRLLKLLLGFMINVKDKQLILLLLILSLLI